MDVEVRISGPALAKALAPAGFRAGIACPSEVPPGPGVVGRIQRILSDSVLEHAVQAAGCAITFDPASSPDLVDYLTVTATSGIEGATIGASLGGLIGLLFGRSGAGAAIGAGLGLVAGAARGVDRLDRGWRVRAIHQIDGTPLVTIHTLGPA